MPSSTFDPFQDWEKKMVAKKAGKLVGHYGYVEEDRWDLEQELFLAIHLTRPELPDELDSRRAMTSRILDNRIRDLISARRAKKRRTDTEAVSLDASIAEEADDDGSYSGVLPQIRRLEAAERAPDPADDEPPFKMTAITKGMTSLQKKILHRLVVEEMTMSEAARSFKMPRTTFNRKVDNIKHLLKRRLPRKLVDE